MYLIPTVPVRPELNATLSGGSVQLSFASQTGVTYQLQSLTNLTSTNWFDEGSALPGTGSEITIPIGTTNTSACFRVWAY